MSAIPELLSPAGSAEAVTAAVESGADAVYLSFGPMQTRGPYDLTEDELGRAAEFARVRGVKVYLSLDALPFDDELPTVLEIARRAQRMGVDAVIAHDLGLIWALRHALPSIPIHAGQKLGIHNRDGLRICSSMGVTRVALPPELSREQLQYLADGCPVELEVAVHGPICPAFAGSCLLPGIHGVSGPCGGLCLPGFTPDVRGRHPLAMRDNCLLDELDFLIGLGVASLRIDGLERRPEYCAAVTGVYSRALGTRRNPSEDDREILKNAFPAAGFTSAYLTGAQVDTMMGAPGAEPEGDTPFYANMRKNYLNHEFQRVPVTFHASLRLEAPLTLTATDDRGNTVSGQGGNSELAFHTETTPAMLSTELYKTGGTPFRCDGVSCDIQKGVYIDPRFVAPVRDELLSQLLERRVAFEPRSESLVPELPPAAGRGEPPVLTVSVLRCSQLSQRLLSLAPPVVYLPLEEAASGDKRAEPFLDSKDISVCAVLPPLLPDSDLGRIAQLLLKARQAGITELAVSNIGHIIFARRLGFDVRGDTGLNVQNSQTLAILLGLRLRSAALPWLTPSRRVREIRKYLDTELVVYGRMPLMRTGACLIRANTGACSCDGALAFQDSSGFSNPVTRDLGCRNTLWSAQKLHLIKRSREYLTSGLWGVRLNFTTENAEECVRIAERYLELGFYEPSSTTQGNF